MFQTTQNVAFALEPLFAAFPHQRNIENFHRYVPLEPSVSSFRQPNGAHSPVADLRDQSVDTKSLTCQAKPSRQFQCTRLEKAFLGQHAVLTKQYFQLIHKSRVLDLQGE